MSAIVRTRVAADPRNPATREPQARLVLLIAALALFSAGMVLLGAPIGAVVRHLSVPDNDDAMRLVQVLDLIHGQGWFDKVQHRFLAPTGVAMHWSRLVDAPLALGILALSPIVGERLASGLVAALWPALLFVAYLATLWFAADRWFGRNAAWLSVFAGTQLATIGLFRPGRVDHHNVQSLAILGIVVALCDRPADAGAAARRGIAAGLLAAFSLAVGLETLPFVAAAGVLTAGAWIIRVPHGRDRLAGFGAALACAAPLLFVLETAPAAWRTPHCDALSAPSLMLACLGGGGAAILAFSIGDGRSGQIRLFAGALLGALTLTAFVVLYPQCVGDPLGPLPEIVRREWLEKVSEALSLPNAMRFSPAVATASLIPIGSAAAYCLWRARVATSDSCTYRYTFLAVFLMLGAVIASIQIRGGYIASAVVPLVAAAALERALTCARQGFKPVQTGLALVAGLAMLGQLVAVTALEFQAILGSPRSGLNTRQIADCVDETSLKGLAAVPPGTVLAPVDLGAAILLRTPHAVIAAPYHRAADGIAAALRGFSGSEADLTREVQATRADYVVLCRAWTSGQPASFANALASGAQVPWLRPVVTGEGEVLAWRVVRLVSEP